MPTNVLITGVSGFLGRYIARHFASLDYQVIGVASTREENAPTNDLANYVQMHLPDPALSRVLNEFKPTVCVHCAGRASVGLSVSDPRADFHAGPVLTWELLNSIRLCAPNCKVICLSSAAVYGSPEALPIPETHILHPISPYGFHKWQSELVCEEFAQLYGMRTAVTRIFSAYGPGLRRQVIWDLCHKALIHGGIQVQGTGVESRDFIHASDIARAVALIAMKGAFNGEAYNLASGRETTTAELVELIKSALSKKCHVAFDGVLPFGTPRNWLADTSKIRSLGFEPCVSIEEGVSAFARWCQVEISTS